MQILYSVKDQDAFTTANSGNKLTVEMKQTLEANREYLMDIVYKIDKALKQ